jgi:hypothetical protein
MKTEDLVALLSTNLEPVDRGVVLRTLCLAAGGGVIVALGIAFLGLGFRSDLPTTRALIFLAVKLAFAIGIVGLAIVYLTRLTRPGGERKDLGFPRHCAIPGHRDSCGNQPRVGPPRALGQDDRGR